MEPSFQPPFTEISLAPLEEMSGRKDYLHKQERAARLKLQAQQKYKQCVVSPSGRDLAETVQRQHCLIGIQRHLMSAEFTIHNPGRVYGSHYHDMMDHEQSMLSHLDTLRDRLWPKDSSIFSVMKTHGVWAPSTYWNTRPETIPRIKEEACVL